MPKVREAIQLIERDGWQLVRTSGSHRQYRHPAIIAGRVRYTQCNYRLLSQFVGTGEVKRQFEELG